MDSVKVDESVVGKQQRIISDRLNEQIKIRAYQKVQLNRKLNQLKISKKNRYNNKKIFNLIENAKKRHTNERKKEIIDLVIKHLFKFITAINNVNGKRNSEQQVKDFYSFANEDCQKIINYIQTTTFFKSFTSLSKGKEKAGNDIVFSFNTELLEDFDNLRDNFEKDLLKEKNVANIIYSLFFMYYFVGGYSDDVKNTKLTIRGANQYDKILKMCEVANNMKPMNCDSLIRNGYSEDDVKMLLEEMSTNNNYNCVEIESLKRNNVNNDGNIDFLFKKNVFDYYATDDFKKKTIENIQQKILFLKKTITLINDFFLNIKDNSIKDHYVKLGIMQKDSNVIDFYNCVRKIFGNIRLKEQEKVEKEFYNTTFAKTFADSDKNKGKTKIDKNKIKSDEKDVLPNDDNENKIKNYKKDVLLNDDNDEQKNNDNNKNNNKDNVIDTNNIIKDKDNDKNEKESIRELSKKYLDSIKNNYLDEDKVEEFYNTYKDIKNITGEEVDNYIERLKYIYQKLEKKCEKIIQQEQEKILQQELEKKGEKITQEITQEIAPVSIGKFGYNDIKSFFHIYGSKLSEEEKRVIKQYLLSREEYEEFIKELKTETHCFTSLSKHNVNIPEKLKEYQNGMIFDLDVIYDEIIPYVNDEKKDEQERKTSKEHIEMTKYILCKIADGKEKSIEEQEEKDFLYKEFVHSPASIANNNKAIQILTKNNVMERETIDSIINNRVGVYIPVFLNEIRKMKNEFKNSTKINLNKSKKNFFINIKNFLFLKTETLKDEILDIKKLSLGGTIQIGNDIIQDLGDIYNKYKTKIDDFLASFINEDGGLKDEVKKDYNMFVDCLNDLETILTIDCANIGAYTNAVKTITNLFNKDIIKDDKKNNTMNNNSEEDLERKRKNNKINFESNLFINYMGYDANKAVDEEIATIGNGIENTFNAKTFKEQEFNKELENTKTEDIRNMTQNILDKFCDKKNKNNNKNNDEDAKLKIESIKNDKVFEDILYNKIIFNNYSNNNVNQTEKKDRFPKYNMFALMDKFNKEAEDELKKIIKIIR